MPICHTHKFIFFHIPRCGGTSLATHFKSKQYKDLFGIVRRGHQVITLRHLTPTDLLHSEFVDHDILQNYFKFSIIRDPFERLASDYLWQQSHDRHNLFKDLSFQAYLNFAEKVLYEGLYFKKLHYDHFRPMTNYCIENDELLVDDILLLENTDTELKRINHHIGDIKMPRINGSVKSYEHLRTTKNIDSVYKLYAADKFLYDRVVQLNSMY